MSDEVKSETEEKVAKISAVIDGKTAETSEDQQVSEDEDIESVDEQIIEETDSETEEPEEVEEEEEDVISDSLLERAIKQGMSIAEAKELGSLALDKVLSRVEKKKDVQVEPETDSLLQEALGLIPEDLSDYEDEIHQGFGKLKSIVEKQAEQIKALGEKVKAEANSWIGSKVSSLGDKVTEDQKKAVLKKFEAMQKGYEAMGEKVSKDEIFSEVSKFVIPQKTTAPRKRTSISRPTRVGLKQNKNPRDQVIEALNKKINGG